MGNNSAKNSESPFNCPILSTYQSDSSSPLRKRSRFTRKSFSLRSLASIGNGSVVQKNITTLFKKRKSPEASIKATTFPRGKRKHNEINQSSYSAYNGGITTFWRDTIFLPEFPFRDDICMSDFKIMNVIGNGTFGEVLRASRASRDHSIVAIKVQNKSTILTKNAIKQVKSEVLLHKNLEPHNFIVRFIDCWQTTTHLYSVMEYVNGYGDLYTLWNDYECVGEEVIRIYAAEIALALGFIHDRDVVYRDLKLENIAIDMYMHIKLVDFGFAKYLDGCQTNTICGTLQYMAPEIAKGEGYGKAVDWWSYGVVLYILLTSKYPYPNANVTTHEQLVFNDYKSPDIHTELCDFLKKLLQVDDHQRLASFQQVVTHQFFTGVSFEDIFNKKHDPWKYMKKGMATSQTTFIDSESFKEEFDGFEYCQDDYT